LAGIEQLRTQTQVPPAWSTTTQQSLERTKVGFRRQLCKAKSYPVPETARDCEENGPVHGELLTQAAEHETGSLVTAASY
jgi:hypothetical protein